MNNIELFNQIYEKYYKSTINNRLGNKELSEIRGEHIQKLYNDMVKEGYAISSIKIVSAILNGCLQQAMKSLIFKIAKNVLADRLRKNNFADSLDELESIKCLEVFDDITSVEIQQILLKMSEIDREIVTLKSYGWSSREIGKIKNMPSSTVRNRLAALKKQIEKELGEPCGRRKHHNTYKT